MTTHNRNTLAQRTPAHSPFAIIYQPKAVPNSAIAKKKTGPKTSRAQRSLTALETPAERRTRQLLANKALSFNVPIATQADSLRTAQIRGRGLR